MDYCHSWANIAFTYITSDESVKKIEKDLTENGVKVIGYKSDASDFTALKN